LELFVLGVMKVQGTILGHFQNKPSAAVENVVSIGKFIRFEHPELADLCIIFYFHLEVESFAGLFESGG